MEQFGVFDEAEPVRRHPGIAERQLEVRVRLLEHHLVAALVLVDVAGHLVERPAVAAERLPQEPLSLPDDPQDGPGSGVIRIVVDPVFRVVRQECVVRVPSSCRESSVAGDEQPVIRAAHNAHEEGGHAIVVSDTVEPLCPEGNVFPSHVASGYADEGVADVHRRCTHGSISPGQGR